MPYFPARKRKVQKLRAKSKRPAKTQLAITGAVARKIVTMGLEQKMYRQLFTDSMLTNAVASAVKYKSMVQIPLGEETYERTGDKVKLNKITADMIFKTNQNVTSDMWALRVSLIRLNSYTDMNFSTFGNIYQNEQGVDQAPLYTDTDGWQGLTQKHNTKLFQVLYDRTYIFGNEATNNGTGLQRIKFSKKVNYNITFDAGANTTRTPIYLFIHAMNVDGHTTTNTLGFTGYISTYYKDY